ncbi:MAG: MATE family efflux transporter [Planctomycetota bacterium]
MSDTQSKGLLALSLPLVISFTIRALLGTVDLIYASQLPGDSAVAAIGLFFPIEFTFIACWVGASAALTSYLSKAMGERHEGQLRQLLRTSLGIVAALSLLFLLIAAALWLLAPHLPRLKPAVVRDFQVYGSTALAGIACCAFWSVIPDSLIKAHHDTRSTMMAGLISGGLNVVLNTVFVYGVGWGIFGIGLATGLARLGSLVYALRRARTLEEARRAEWAAAPPPPARKRRQRPGYTVDGLLNRPLAQLLALGVPSALTYVLMATEGLLVNGVLTFLGDPTAALAAYAVYHRAQLLALMPVVATGVAVLPFVARHVGERRFDQVRSELRAAFLVHLGYVLLVVTPACFLLAPVLAGGLAESPTTRELAGFAIRFGAPLAALCGLPFILCRPAFEALQRGAPGLAMAFVRYALLSGPLALAGAWAARRAGAEPFHGLIAGLVTGSGIVSLIFTLWLARTLRALGAPQGGAPSGASAASAPG